MKYYLSIIILSIIAMDASAQSFYKYKRGRDIIASIGTGTTSYFGDLNDDGDIFDFKPNFNIGLQYFVADRIAIRSELLWFQLEGDDSSSEEPGRVARNLSFSSNNFELNAVGIFQLLPEGRRYYQRPFFNVYAFAGIGLLYFNPKAELDGEKYALQPIQTEGVSYSRISVVIPYGIGIRYKMNPFINIVLEGGFRQTFTDYIDDVSSTYIDNNSFSDPVHAALADRTREINLDVEVRQEGSRRGNPDNNDNYFLYNIKLEFYLPPQFLSSAKANSKNRKRKKRARKR